MRYQRLLAALALIVAGQAAWAKPPSLSPAEVRRLDRGEVLVLDVNPPGGSRRAGQGGTAIAATLAPPEVVWRVLVDYPRHAGLFPRVARADVLEAEPGRALVRYAVQVGPFAFRFHVQNHLDAARRRLSWHLDATRPNDLFRESWGYWQVERWGEGSLVTYAMAAETMLPAFLIRGAERDSLVQTVRAVRDRAEHGG
jgi:hypothetical protein